jgi:hypothetical protein
VVVYYGHFGEVYRTALRVRAHTTATQSQTGTAAPAQASPARAALPLQARLTNALTFTVAAIGWPILILAAAGIWRLWADEVRDRGVFLVAAWGVAALVFLGIALMRVDAPFQRYAAEFFGRVLFATYPAAVMLAARSAAWAWRAGLAPRIASAVVLLCAVVVGVQHWLGWIQ